MIGIYGGTFDPVHFGHLRTAVEVREVFNLQKLLLLPSHQPPHRAMPGASSKMRLEMLQIAINNQSGLEIDTREIDRKGPSYMVDTLQSLRLDYQQQPILLYMGLDAFADLTSWHRWQALFDYAHIVVMDRPDSKISVLSEYLKSRQVDDRRQLKQSLHGKLFFQKVTQLEISASQIREIFFNQKDPAYLLPEEVISYIYQHKLYQDTECKQTNC